jgi:hypothetical protein
MQTICARVIQIIDLLLMDCEEAIRISGTYFEKKTGEKLAHIEEYKNEYLKQIIDL